MAGIAPQSPTTDQRYWLNIAQNWFAVVTAAGKSPIVDYPYPGEPQNTLMRKVASLTSQIAT